MAKLNKLNAKRWIIQFGLSTLVKASMILIVVIAFYAAFSGALTTARALGFTGVAALGFAALPDALMVLSAARMRQAGLSPHQRKHAQRAMRFGLSFSMITNALGAFLIIAPNGSWINPHSVRELWLQHAMAALTIIWHTVPVIILWYGTEMITRPKVEPASIKENKIIKPKAVVRQRKALSTVTVPASI